MAQPYLDKIGLQAKKINNLTLTRLSLAWQNPLTFLQALEVGYESYFQSVDISAWFGFGGIRVGADSLDDEKRRVEFLQVFFTADI